MKELYLSLLAVKVRIINAQRKQVLARIKIRGIVDEKKADYYFICSNCDSTLPKGCSGIFADQENCMVRIKNKSIPPLFNIHY